MTDRKWAELARAEGELITLRFRLSVATQNADQLETSQLIAAIARAEDGRDEMVAIITGVVAAD